MAMTLEMLVTRKQQLESDLKQLEKHIFDLETAYLEEPGNITNNWEVWNVMIYHLFYVLLTKLAILAGTIDRY